MYNGVCHPSLGQTDGIAPTSLNTEFLVQLQNQIQVTKAIQTLTGYALNVEDLYTFHSFTEVLAGIHFWRSFRSKLLLKAGLSPVLHQVSCSFVPSWVLKSPRS